MCKIKEDDVLEVDVLAASGVPMHKDEIVQLQFGNGEVSFVYKEDIEVIEEDEENCFTRYSGDIELGRAKLRIKELEQELTSYNHLKSISWNLNRIANVLEDNSPTHTAGEKIGQSLRDLIKKKSTGDTDE